MFACGHYVIRHFTSQALVFWLFISYGLSIDSCFQRWAKFPGFFYDWTPSSTSYWFNAAWRHLGDHAHPNSRPVTCVYVWTKLKGYLTTILVFWWFFFPFEMGAKMGWEDRKERGRNEEGKGFHRPGVSFLHFKLCILPFVSECYTTRRQNFDLYNNGGLQTGIFVMILGQRVFSWLWRLLIGQAMA
jgi:hypothetical protein